MWYPFFVVGGIAFWSLAVIELILLTWFVEEEWPAQSFFSVLLFIAAIHLFGDANLLTYVKMNTSTFFAGALVYLVAGIVWSLAKFYFYTNRLRRKIEGIKDKYRTYKKEWTAHNDDGWRSGSDKNAPYSWEIYLKNELNSEDSSNLTFGNYSGRIIFWLAYWPVSMFWTLLNDPIKRIATWVYETCLVGIYKKIHEVTIGKAIQFEE